MIAAHFQRQIRVLKRTSNVMGPCRSLLYPVPLLLAAVAWCEGAVFYLSEHSPGNSASPTNPRFEIRTGDDVTLHLYFEPDAADSRYLGIAVNIETSSPLVVNGTALQVVNPDVTVAGVAVGTRWNDPVGGAIGDGTELFRNLAGVNVTARGLDAANIGGQPGVFLDEGFDPTSAAFYFGQVTLRAESAGVAELFLSVGNTLIAREGDTAESSVMVQFGAGDIAVSGAVAGATGTVADATITVLGDPPEDNGPEILGFEFDTSQQKYEINWSAAVGKSYAVERSADLMQWTEVAQSGPVTAETATISGTFIENPSAHYYRIREL